MYAQGLSYIRHLNFTIFCRGAFSWLYMAESHQNYCTYKYKYKPTSFQIKVKLKFLCNEKVLFVKNLPLSDMFYGPCTLYQKKYNWNSIEYSLFINGIYMNFLWAPATWSYAMCNVFLMDVKVHLDIFEYHRGWRAGHFQSCEENE